MVSREGDNKQTFVPFSMDTDLLRAWAKRCFPPAASRAQLSLCGGGGWGAGGAQREQTDGYTASPVITGINWVNHRLSSCSPCGRRGSDTVMEN